jgi:PIN domain nuclease of toxin-antitoxin system
VTRSVLLDTHTFVWYAVDHPALTLPARDAIAGALEVYVSAASVWEVRTKVRLGKLSIAAALAAAGLPTVIAAFGFEPLSVDVDDGDLAGSFPQAHGDPFDRMLAAQAVRRGLALVSNDTALDVFGVSRVW